MLIPTDYTSYLDIMFSVILVGTRDIYPKIISKDSVVHIIKLKVFG